MALSCGKHFTRQLELALSSRQHKMSQLELALFTFHKSDVTTEVKSSSLTLNRKSTVNKLVHTISQSKQASFQKLTVLKFSRQFCLESLS